MPRFQRFLGSAAANSSAVLPAAPPPEAVALESDFVVILAALLCAVICVVGLLAVARCAWLRRSLGGGATGSGQPAANKGVKKKVLQSLPKFTYGTAVDGGVTAAPPKLATECAICLVEFAEGDEIRALPPCGHVFHVGCIDTWLGSHSSCPSCRQILMVARCNKCGHFPAPVSESELSVRVDHANHGAPATGNAISSSSSSAATTTTTTTTCSNNFLP